MFCLFNLHFYLTVLDFKVLSQLGQWKQINVFYFSFPQFKSLPDLFRLFELFFYIPYETGPDYELLRNNILPVQCSEKRRTFDISDEKSAVFKSVKQAKWSKIAGQIGPR